MRTDPDAPKHKGISTLLVDMKSPGVEVRPLRTMAGDLTFSELFFTDVVVPKANLLGNLNEGWRVAMTTLSYERAGVARLHLSLRDRLNRLMDDAKGLPAMSDPVIRDRLMAIYARIATMGWTTTRELQAIGAGRQPSAMMGSIAKLMWSLIEQALAELAVDLLGLEALGRTLGQEPGLFAAEHHRRGHDGDQPQHPGRARPGAAPVVRVRPGTWAARGQYAS